MVQEVKTMMQTYADDLNELKLLFCIELRDAMSSE